MVSKNSNSKVANEISRKVAKMDVKKQIVANKLNGDIGLIKPGSNWERFKSVIAETATKEIEVPVNKVKRKKHFRPFHTATESVPPLSGNDKRQNTITNTENEKNHSPSKGLTKAIAMDCEMVGIGEDGVDSMIARVSIVNKNGYCIYDKYVKPTEKVTNFRTAISGIRPCHLAEGEDFTVVQKEVADILKGRILVGHALHNDLAVLFLSHPRKHQRDTSKYKLFKKVSKGNTPSLKKLASELLGIDIQSGEHSSIEDARSAMQLYQLYKKKWELDIKTKSY